MQSQTSHQLEDKIKQEQSCLKNMPEFTLDWLIQQNLVKSLQYQRSKHTNQSNKSETYNKGQYQKFKRSLLDILKDFRIWNKEIQHLLEQSLDDDYYDNILRIRSKIHPIYVPQLERVVTKNTQMLKDKDVIVLMGPTGCGKTTITQILLGYRLRKSKNQLGISTLTVQGELSQQHKQFVAKYSSKSVTKHISAIQLNLPSSHQHYGVFYIADTPGFFDSEGTLVDAANSFTTVKLLRQANSVRFIFVLNKNNEGTRVEGFKKLADIIAQLFQKFDPTKIMYFLNCYTQEDIVQLAKQTADLVTNGLNEKEKGNHNFVLVVHHFHKIINKAKIQSEKLDIPISQVIKQKFDSLVVIDPLNPDLQQIYNKVLNEDIPINNPRDQLLSTKTAQVKQAITAQANVLSAMSNRFLEQQNIPSAFYYLRQLETLNEITSDNPNNAQEEVKYMSIVGNMKQIANKKFQKFQKFMKNRLVSEANEAIYEQTSALRDQLMKIQEDLKQTQIGIDFQFENKLASLITQKTAELRQLINQNKLDAVFIQNVLWYSKYFEKDLEKQINSIISSQEKQLKKQVQNCVEKQDFFKLNQILSRKELNGQLKIQDYDWDKQIQTKISERRQKIDSIFNTYQFETINKFDLQYLNKTLKLYNGHNFNKHLVKINKFAEDVKKKIDDYVLKNFTKLKKQVDAQNEVQKQMALTSKSQQFKRIINNMLLIQQVNQTIKKVQDLLNQYLANKIGSIIEQIDFDDFDMNLQSNQSHVHLSKIYKSLKSLNKILSLIQQGNDKDQAKQIIQQKQKAFIEIIQRYNKEQVQKINMETFNKQIPVNQIANGCRLLKAVFDNKKQIQTQKNAVVGVFRTLKQKLQQKIQKVIESLHKFIEDNMKCEKQYQQQNKQKYLQQLSKQLGNIKNLYKWLSLIPSKQMQFLGLSTALNNINIYSGKSLINIINSLAKNATMDIKSIRKLIQQVQKYKDLDQKKYVKMLKYRLNFFKKFKQSKQIPNEFVQQAINAYEQPIKQFKQLKDVIQQSYQATVHQKQKYQSLSSFTRICKSLTDIGNDFQRISKDIKQKFQEKNSQLLAKDVRSCVNIKEGSIKTEQLTELYQFYNKFGNDPIYLSKKNKLIQCIKIFMKQQEKGLEDNLKRLRINPKKLESYQSLQVCLTKINNLFQLQQQCQGVVKDASDIFKISENMCAYLQTKIEQILIKFQKQMQLWMQTSKDPENQTQQAIAQYEHILETLRFIKLPEVKAKVQKRVVNFNVKTPAQYFDFICQFSPKKSSKTADPRPFKSEAININMDHNIQSQSQNKYNMVSSEIICMSPQNKNRNSAKDQEFEQKQNIKILCSQKPKQQNQQKWQKQKIYREPIEHKNYQQLFGQIQNQNVIQQSDNNRAINVAIVLEYNLQTQLLAKFLNKYLVKILKQVQCQQKKNFGMVVKFSLIFIRNYFAQKDHIFMATDFQQEVDKLQKYLTKQKYQFPADNDLALQIVYNYATNQKNIDQLIIMANQQSNSDNSNQFKYWVSPNYPKLKQSEQYNKLRKCKIKINSLYTGADKYYQRISKETAGYSQKITQYTQEKFKNFFIKCVSPV